MNATFTVNVNPQLFDLAISKVSELMRTIDPSSSVSAEGLSSADLADIQKGIAEYKSGKAALYTLSDAKKYLDDIVSKYE